MRELCTVGDVVGKLYLPTGYVKANGAEVLREDYPRLVNLAEKYNLWTEDTATYPAMFGQGDGSATFVLPDWRGDVMRFLDDGKGYDADRVLGTYQEDAIRNITGEFTTTNNIAYPTRAEGVFKIVKNYGGRHQNGSDFGYRLRFEAAYQVPTAAENRVKNIALIPCMRY